MSFNTNTGKQSFTATGSQTDFTFNFKIYEDTDIKVYLTAEGVDPDDDNDVLTVNSDYTVSIDGDDGGTVTLTSGATLNDTIVINRELPITRSVSYVTNGDLKAATLNEDQDYQTYLAIDANTKNSNALIFQDSEITASRIVPSPVAASYLKWNSTGTALVNDTSGQVVRDDVNLTVNSISEFRNITTSPSTVYVTGYHTANDGAFGSNFFKLVDSGTDNDGTIIETVNGVYELQYEGDINVKWFGAVGDGDTDDTDAIQSAVSLGGTISFNSSSTYSISDITLPSNVTLDGNGCSITFETSSQYGFIFSGGGVEVKNFYVEFNKNSNFIFSNSDEDIWSDISIHDITFTTGFMMTDSAIYLVNTIDNLKLYNLNFYDTYLSTNYGINFSFGSGQSTNAYIDNIYAEGFGKVFGCSGTGNLNSVTFSNIKSFNANAGAFSTYHANDGIYSNIWIEGHAEGAYIWNAKAIEGMVLTGGTDVGVTLEQISGNIDIRSTSNGSHGVVCTWGGTESVLSVSAFENGGHGLYIKSDTTGSTGRDLLVTNCVIQDNTMDGIRFLDGDGAYSGHIRVSNCLIENNDSDSSYSGIHLEGIGSSAIWFFNNNTIWNHNTAIYVNEDTGGNYYYQGNNLKSSGTYTIEHTLASGLKRVIGNIVDNVTKLRMLGTNHIELNNFDEATDTII